MKEEEEEEEEDNLFGRITRNFALCVRAVRDIYIRRY